MDDILFYEAKPGKFKRHRKMKTVTLTQKQKCYVLENRANKTILELSKDLGITSGRLYSNMQVMGLCKRRRSKNEINYLIWKYTVNI